MPKEIEPSTMARQAKDLNSPAYALVQALSQRYRESAYIDAVIAEPGSLTEAYNPLGTTALMRAAELGSRHLARILEAGADPLATDSMGRSAIFYAAKTGQVEAIDTLVSWGASPELVDTSHGETALHVACRSGQDAAVQLLAGELGVSYAGHRARRRSDGFSPLHEAARWGHHGCAKVLLMVADLAVEKAARREKAVAANANDPSSISSSSSSAASRPTSALELNALATRMVNAEALVAAPRGAAAARAAAPGGGGGEGHGGSHGGAQALLPRVHLTPILLAAQYGHLQVLWVLVQSGKVQQSVNAWLPQLTDVEKRKTLFAWTDTVMRDPRMQYSGAAEYGHSTAAAVVAEMYAQLDEAEVPYVDDDDVDDGSAGDY